MTWKMWKQNSDGKWKVEREKRQKIEQPNRATKLKNTKTKN